MESQSYALLQSQESALAPGMQAGPLQNSSSFPLLAKIHRSSWGKLSDPEAPQVFDLALLAVDHPMLELWRTSAGLLQSLSISRK